MAATIPESICWSLLLDGCIYTSDLSLYMYSIMDGCAYTIYSCIRDVSCIFNYRSSNSGVWFERILVKHFNPPSLRPHALGGICYIAFCHCPCNPHPAHWRIISVTNKKCHALQIPSLHPLPWGQHSFCWQFPEKTIRNTCFWVGASRPL